MYLPIYNIYCYVLYTILVFFFREPIQAKFSFESTKQFAPWQ